MTYEDAYKKVKPFTMLTGPRLRALWDAVQSAPAGALVECGVCRGGALALMMLAGPARAAFGYDTFSGVTPPTEKDAWPGYYERSAAELSDVTDQVKGASLIRLNLETDPVIIKVPVAVLHIDVDWYLPTLRSLQMLGQSVVSGGTIIVDDYAFVGCRAAVEECGRPEDAVRVDESIQWRVK